MSDVSFTENQIYEFDPLGSESGTVSASVPVELIDEIESPEPPRKKKKVQLDSSTAVMKEFASEMIKIETERTEMMKEKEDKRLLLEAERNKILKEKQETVAAKNVILQQKNELAKERNELLRKLLEK